MSDIIPVILSKTEKIEADVTNIMVAVTENTVDLKHHIKRTNDLQAIVEDLHTIVTPLHEEFVARKAVEKYKEETKTHKMKIPATIYYIVATMIALGTITAWLMKVKF